MARTGLLEFGRTRQPLETLGAACAKNVAPLVVELTLWLVAAFWLRGTLLMIREVRQLDVLPAFDHTPSVRPYVSVLIAARDEAAVIESTIRGLLAQQHVDLEVIIANDRSTDSTGEILRRLANEDDRVRAVTIDILPDRWLGKCHALQQASTTARGQWLLLSDADVRLASDAIARAVRYAERQNVEHVTAWFNSHHSSSWGAAAWIAFLLGGLPDHLGGVNRDRPGAFAGTGAFNLVRADAYRQAGGHAALRLTVFEDVKLGLLLRAHGFRTRVLLGGCWVTADWGVTVGRMIRLLEKNSFSFFNYRLRPVVFLVLLIHAMWLLALFGPWLSSVAGVAALVSMGLTSVPATMYARRSAISMLPAVLVPLVWTVPPLILANSAWVTLRQGGVRWRDTFYPLAMLRAGDIAAELDSPASPLTTSDSVNP